MTLEISTSTVSLTLERNKMYQKIELLFSIFLITGFGIWDSLCQSQHYCNFKRCHDIKGNMSEFSRVRNTDMLHCAQLCLQDTKCTSYSYKQDNRECALYEANAGVEKRTSTLQYIYIKLPENNAEQEENKPDVNAKAIKTEELHQACRDGKLDVVKYILTHRLADIDSRGKTGKTPVMEAAVGGHLKVFTYLVERGCNMSLTFMHCMNLLHIACYGGNIQIVKNIVEGKQCNMEGKGLKGRTPVFFAVESGETSIVDFLMSKGCNLKAVGDDASTILHVACAAGRVGMVKHILVLGVVVIETRNSKGRTPVMLAVFHGHMSVVEFLIHKNCNLKAVDKSGGTILHLACFGGHVDMVKYILSLGVVDIGSRDVKQMTPVMHAAGTGRKSVVDYLISKFCNLKAVDTDGSKTLNISIVKRIVHLDMADIETLGSDETEIRYGSVVDFLISKHCNLKAVDDQESNILHVACQDGHVDMVKYILSLKIADEEGRGHIGRTPVMYATLFGHLSLVDFLKSKHCSLKAVDDQGGTILHVACEGGHVDMVKHIFYLGVADKESRGHIGRTPVMYAAQCGHKLVVDFLISKHCDLNAVDNQGGNILHLVCAGGNVEMVKYISSLAVVDIESRGLRKMTPAMCAVLNGHIPVVDFLISKHCNLKSVDTYHSNILHVACLGGHVDMVKYIFSLGVADIESKGLDKMTPVMYAVLKGHRSVVVFLAAKHCNLKAVDEHRSNILHVACSFGDVELVKYILSLGVHDLESRCSMKKTPVMYAVQKGHRSVVDFLISKHCNLKAVNAKGNTILHLACKSGQVAMVKHILSLGVVDTENRNLKKMTPVMLAVRYDHKQVVDVLVSKHCNLKAVDAKGNTILHSACEKGHVDMVKHIISLSMVDIESRGYNNMTPVMYAVLRGHRPVMDFLVSKHCNMKAVDGLGGGIFHTACAGGHINMVKYILSLEGADIEIKTDERKTPVMYAVMEGHRLVVDFLISKHCNLQVVDKLGSNILHLACLGGHVNMVKHILSLGVADIESKGFSRMTPVMYAVLRNSISVVEFLVSKHCNLNVVDNQGNTIIKIACKYNFNNMVKYIDGLGGEQRGCD